MSRTKKISQLKQVDGKAHTQYRSLDELFGYRGTPYKTMDETEYFTQIGGMNKADLYNEAVKVGLLPHDDRAVLTDRLMREFRRYINGLNINKVQPKQLKVNKVAKDIVAESANKPLGY